MSLACLQGSYGTNVSGFRLSCSSGNESGDITIEGEGALAGIDIEVPGDISSAAFFMVAAEDSEGSANLLCRP